MLYVLLDIFVRIQLNMASVQTIAIYMSIYYKGFEQHCEQNVKITSLSTTGKKSRMLSERLDQQCVIYDS